jgi:Fe-S-cluster containining protein
MKSCDICSKKCLGVDNQDGGCCSIQNRDFIIGPHTDSEIFLKNLSDKLNREIKFSEVFYDFEEGSKVFPNKKSWQYNTAYPALKIDFSHPKKNCIFYNTELKYCTIYEIRPKACRDYECNYLKNNKTNSQI